MNYYYSCNKLLIQSREKTNTDFYPINTVIKNLQNSAFDDTQFRDIKNTLFFPQIPIHSPVSENYTDVKEEIRRIEENLEQLKNQRSETKLIKRLNSISSSEICLVSDIDEVNRTVKLDNFKEDSSKREKKTQFIDDNVDKRKMITPIIEKEEVDLDVVLACIEKIKHNKSIPLCNRSMILSVLSKACDDPGPIITNHHSKIKRIEPFDQLPDLSTLEKKISFVERMENDPQFFKSMMVTLKEKDPKLFKEISQNSKAYFEKIKNSKVQKFF